MRLGSAPAVEAFIAIGANIDNPLRNCRKGAQAIDALPGCCVTGESKWYRTAPVGFDHPDWFVNGAIRIETTVAPIQLLDNLLAIEAAMGRVRTGGGYGPRPLDLDLVLYGNQVLDSFRLTLPHPRMHKRRFVLQPICDIDPFVMHPILCATAQDLLVEIHDPDQAITPI